MTVLESSGEEHSGLVGLCASLTAANIEKFKNSYPFFGNSNIQQAQELLDLTKGAHEMLGERTIKLIFHEAEERGLPLRPRILVYCNDVPKEDFIRNIPGCDLDFAFDDKEAIEKMRRNEYDGLIFGFWETKIKSLGAEKNIHALYLDAGDRKPYIIGEHHPEYRKALLALPNFQADYIDKFVFNFMIDKPLKRYPELHEKFLTDRIRNGMFDFENAVREKLSELDPEEMLVYSKLLSIYGVKEQKEKRQTTRIIDGGKLLRDIKRKTALYPVSTELP